MITSYKKYSKITIRSYTDRIKPNLVSFLITVQNVGNHALIIGF